MCQAVQLHQAHQAAMAALMPTTCMSNITVLSVGVSVLDPQQAGVLSSAGLQLQQADEAAVTAVTVVLRSLQDLERLIREASSPDIRDG